MKTIQIFAMVFVLFAGFIFWRLSAEPWDAGTIVPRIAKAILPPESGLTLSAEDAFLKTAFNKDGILQVEIKNMVLKRADGTVVTNLPVVDMVYGFGKILTLNAVPDVLYVKDASANVIISENGEWMLLSHEGTKRETADVSSVSAEPKAVVSVSEKQMKKIVNYFLSFDKIALMNGKVFVDNRQTKHTLHMPKLNFSMEHDSRAEYTLRALGVVQSGKVSVNIGFDALLNRSSKQMPFDLSFDNVDLSAFSQLASLLKEIKLTVQGNISGRLDLANPTDRWQDMIKELSFRVQSKKPGSVSLPAPLTNVYPIKGLFVQGAIASDIKSISVKDSVIELKTGPIAHVAMDVTGLEEYLNTGDLAYMHTVLKADVTDVTINQVPDVWPSALGPDAHKWVKDNLSKGEVDKALFTLYFQGSDLTDLKGDMEVSGVTVDYLSPMPKAHNAGGRVYLYPDRVEIFADTGELGSIKLRKGELYFTDLNAPVGRAKIKLSAVGPVDEAMKVIDSKPLGFAKMYGINPVQTGGSATVDMMLEFPLVETLQVKDVKAEIEAKITNGSFVVPIKNMPDVRATKGALVLNVDNRGLSLSGRANVKDDVLTVLWQEYFTPKGKDKLEATVEVTGKVSDETLKAFYGDAGDFVRGNTSVKANVKRYATGKSDVSIQFDFINAAVDVQPISLQKKSGQQMNLQVDFKTKADAILYPVTFDAAGEKDLSIKGSIDKTKDFVLTLDRVKTPQSDFKGRIRTGEKVEIVLTGKKLDMTKVKEMSAFNGQSAAKGEQKIRIPNAEHVPPDVLLNIVLDEMVMKEGMPFRNVSVKGNRRGSDWKDLRVSAEAAEPFTVNFSPIDRKLNGYCADAGDLIERLGGSGKLTGGRLTMWASEQNAGGFKGEIVVKDFEVKDVGFLTQAMTILGIVDAIRGKELHFKRMVVPFELTPYQTMFIADGLASGTSLGVTFGGRISFDNVALSGTVVPAYAINALPGKIPLVGGLFKSSEGGGLFGVPYDVTGSIGNLETEFHALSGLAPGILGKLFQ